MSGEVGFDPLYPVGKVTLDRVTGDTHGASESATDFTVHTVCSTNMRYNG